MRHVLVALLRAYRFAISPLYGQVCRYHPTCSAYALDAVQTHGAARGTWLAARRIGRCHPWAAGGVDHVPGSAAEARYLHSEREAAASGSPSGSPTTRPTGTVVATAMRQGA